MSCKKERKKKKRAIPFLGSRQRNRSRRSGVGRLAGCRAGRGPEKSGATAGGRTQGPGGLASTYQARPRHVPSDSRLTPVRGSAQPPPPPPRASGLFPPSLRFPGSEGAPLGPDFFRLFTSDMSEDATSPGRLLHPGGSGLGLLSLRGTPQR